MDKDKRTTLRHFLATPHKPRTINELHSLHWLATVMTDEIQQAMEPLEPTSPPDSEPAEKTTPAKKSAGTPKADTPPGKALL